MTFFNQSYIKSGFTGVRGLKRPEWPSETDVIYAESSTPMHQNKENNSKYDYMLLTLQLK